MTVFLYESFLQQRSAEYSLTRLIKECLKHLYFADRYQKCSFDILGNLWYFLSRPNPGDVISNANYNTCDVISNANHNVFV